MLHRLENNRFVVLGAIVDCAYIGKCNPHRRLGHRRPSTCQHRHRGPWPTRSALPLKTQSERQIRRRRRRERLERPRRPGPRPVSSSRPPTAPAVPSPLRPTRRRLPASAARVPLPTPADPPADLRLRTNPRGSLPHGCRPATRSQSRGKPMTSTKISNFTRSWRWSCPTPPRCSPSSTRTAT
jgi:hypothetical protein